jgi:hypothetical protein
VVERDTGGDPVVERRGTWRVVSAETDADDRDGPLVDRRAFEEPVERGADDVLPVGARGQPLLAERGTLPRTLEQEDVVAARKRLRNATEEVEFLHERVEAAETHHRGTGSRAVTLEEVPRQSRVLVRDRDLFRRGVEQGHPSPERLAARLIGGLAPRVVAREEELGRPIVGVGAEEGDPRGSVVPGRAGRLGCASDPLGGTAPLGVPSLGVTVVDALDSHQHLARFSAAEGRVRERAERLVVEPPSIEVNLHTASTRPHAMMLCRRVSRRRGRSAVCTFRG